VTIVLLNLLIAIVNESYDKIRASAHFESLRNKAFLIISTESLLRKVGIWWPFMKLASCCRGRDCHGSDGMLVNWIFKKLSAPLVPDNSSGENGRNDENKNTGFLYVITVRRAFASITTYTRKMPCLPSLQYESPSVGAPFRISCH
jgi:hypothetical protein